MMDRMCWNKLMSVPKGCTHTAWSNMKGPHAFKFNRRFGDKVGRLRWEVERACLANKNAWVLLWSYNGLWVGLSSRGVATCQLPSRMDRYKWMETRRGENIQQGHNKKTMDKTTKKQWTCPTKGVGQNQEGFRIWKIQGLIKVTQGEVHPTRCRVWWGFWWRVETIKWNGLRYSLRCVPSFPKLQGLLSQPTASRDPSCYSAL